MERIKNFVLLLKMRTICTYCPQRKRLSFVADIKNWSINTICSSKKIFVTSNKSRLSMHILQTVHNHHFCFMLIP